MIIEKDKQKQNKTPIVIVALPYYMELANIIRLDNFYTPQQYATAGSFSINTTRNRIRSGLIVVLKIDGREFIDIEKNPPNTRYKPNKEHKPSIPLLPNGINKEILVHIPSYSRNKGHGSEKFFEAVLAGKIFGLVIGGEVFAYKQELEALEKTL